MTSAAARAALLVLLAGALAAACIGCQRGGVVRVVGGEEHVGPFVAPDAYAAYARGAVAEREGRLDLAAAAYAEAVAETRDALIFARLGAVLCRMGRGIAAAEQFARGYDADPRAAVVFRERARCALQQKDWATALRASEHAVQLDPEDRESLEIRIEALVRSGRKLDADALREEGASRHGRTAQDRPAVFATSVRPGADVRPTLHVWRGDLAEVDDALARGALDEASARATHMRLARSAFAARALAFGHLAYAREVARRVAAADPRDASARFVAAAGADLASDDAELTRALASTEPAAPPSDLARLLFAEVLVRRRGREAAASILPPPLLERSREDPVEERIRLRLVAAMSPTPAAR